MIAILLGVKLASKAVGVWPVASAFRIPRRERAYLAQQFFQPTVVDQEEEEALGAEDATTIARRVRS